MTLSELFFCVKSRGAVCDSDFKEADHPRDESGRFSASEKKGNFSTLKGNFSGYNKSEKERKSELQNAKAIKIDIAEYKDKTIKECREIAKSEYSKLQPVEKDGITIEFKPFGFRETKAHSADKNVLYVLGKMDNIIKNAVFMYAEPNTDEKKSNTIDILNYAAKTNIDGKEYYTRIVIRRDKDGNFYYDNDSTSIEKAKANIDILLPAYQQRGFTNNSPYVDRISQWLFGVKFNKNNKHDTVDSLSGLFEQMKNRE